MGRKITLLKAKDDHFRYCNENDAIAGCTSCGCFAVCSYYPFLRNVEVAEICKYFILPEKTTNKGGR